MKISMLTDEDKDHIRAIFRGVWLSPDAFLEALKRHIGQQNLKIQLKGSEQRNHSGIITSIIGDRVEINYGNNEVIKVDATKIAGFTTPTDWYRQRKS